MAVDIQIRDFKCFNQLKNGDDFSLNTSDFTSNLVGNVGEKVRVQFTLNLTWYAQTAPGQSWVMQGNRLVRQNGSFLDDGFTVGDNFEFIQDWVNRSFDVGANDQLFTATVDYVSSDGKILEFTVTDGQNTLTGELTDVGIWGRAQDTGNKHESCIYKFGLIGNDEDFNTLSKVTNSDQAFYISQLQVGSYESFSVVSNNNDWVTGDLQGFIGVPFARNSAPYFIRHEFVINPWYVVGELSNLQENIIPDLLKGDNSLRYAVQVEFRKTLTDTLSSKVQVLDGVKGSVGWFNENFNGYDNNYTVDSVSYQDTATLNPADGIQLGASTTINATISGRTFNTGDRVALYVSYLPDDESEYIDKVTNLPTNFLYDSITHSADDIESVGTGVIKSMSSDVVGGNLQVTAEIDYTTEQFLRLTRESNYAIWLQVEDPALSAGSSDRVALLIDINNYQQGAFIPDLLGFDKLDILTHTKTLGSDVGSSTATQWNEDGLLLDFDFWLDTSKQSLLTSIEFSLVGYNVITGESFVLDNFSIDTSTSKVSGGIQEIQVDTTRGYVLAEGDQFNNVKIAKDVLDGDLQHYIGSFGQKIKWQDWISNDNVDPIFFDAAEENNNLNYKSSNYSNLNNYQVRVLVTARLTGIDELGREGLGFEQNTTGNITVLDYNSPDVGTWTAEIKTYDPDTLADTGGVILKNKDTLFVSTWEATGAILDDVYAIHRIQETGSLGDDISELSSVRDRLVGDLLKPLDGEDYLRITDNAGVKTVECLIDYTKIKPNAAYDLSAKLETVEPAFAFTLMFGQSGNVTFTGSAVVYGGTEYASGDPIPVNSGTAIFFLRNPELVTSIVCEDTMNPMGSLNVSGLDVLDTLVLKNGNFNSFIFDSTAIQVSALSYDLTNSIIDTSSAEKLIDALIIANGGTISDDGNGNYTGNPGFFTPPNTRDILIGSLTVNIAVSQEINDKLLYSKIQALGTDIIDGAGFEITTIRTLCDTSLRFDFSNVANNNLTTVLSNWIEQATELNLNSMGINDFLNYNWELWFNDPNTGFQLEATGLQNIDTYIQGATFQSYFDNLFDTGKYTDPVEMKRYEIRVNRSQISTDTEARLDYLKYPTSLGGRTCGIVIDITTIQAYVSYGVRLLQGNYTGPCVRVVNNLSQEYDIPFSNGFADWSYADSIANGGDLFITVIYDQTGREKHLTPFNNTYKAKLDTVNESMFFSFRATYQNVNIGSDITTDNPASLYIHYNDSIIPPNYRAGFNPYGLLLSTTTNSVYLSHSIFNNVEAAGTYTDQAGALFASDPNQHVNSESKTVCIRKLDELILYVDAEELAKTSIDVPINDSLKITIYGNPTSITQGEFNTHIYSMSLYDKELNQNEISGF